MFPLFFCSSDCIHTAALYRTTAKEGGGRLFYRLIFVTATYLVRYNKEEKEEEEGCRH